VLVHVIYMADAQRRGPDLNKVGKVIDLDDDLARQMLGEGTAVTPTVDELAAYKKAKPAPAYDEGGSLPPGEAIAANTTDEPEPVAAPSKPGNVFGPTKTGLAAARQTPAEAPAEKPTDK
jgi:hypothetical protein